ncbi:4Fe-4S ferredoxin [Anaerolentibacter hominis]|uniref:4Fe-4S ferredoxin n=1 Tax=Anaerolentibacter hominis TaxID=3079009 RepID=UPI0031B89830
MRAVRNIRLCTKDCLCLYVCPVGATDTETGQIDAFKCIEGCRLCVDACPSHAISLVPDQYSPQQKKDQAVIRAMRALAESKTKQESAAQKAAESSEDPFVRQFASAIAKSNRIMAEDILREAGYMLPQSRNTHDFLEKLLKEAQGRRDFPMDAVKRLIELLPCNE